MCAGLKHRTFMDRNDFLKDGSSEAKAAVAQYGNAFTGRESTPYLLTRASASPDKGD